MTKPRHRVTPKPPYHEPEPEPGEPRRLVPDVTPRLSNRRAELWEIELVLRARRAALESDTRRLLAGVLAADVQPRTPQATELVYLKGGSL